jgi:hypothetical protein
MGSRAPQRGLAATQSQNHKRLAAMLIADIVEARSRLLELSNSGCLPGRAGGLPFVATAEDDRRFIPASGNLQSLLVLN